MRMPRTALSLSLPLTLLLATSCLNQACGLFSPYPYQATRAFSIEVLHQPGSAIRVESKNGFIRLLAVPEAEADVVTIEVKLKACGKTAAEAEERAAGVIVSGERNATGRLLVRAEFPDDWRGRGQASFTVRLPDAHGIQVETSNGQVTAEGLSGPLDVHTSNGRIQVSGHRGKAVLRTSNGAVTLGAHAGSAQIRTSNGAVQVHLGLDQRGPVDVQTSNGAIHLTVGEGFGGNLGMRTSNGRIQVKDPGGHVQETHVSRHQGQMVFANAGSESRLAASNGAITVEVER